MFLFRFGNYVYVVCIRGFYSLVLKWPIDITQFFIEAIANPVSFAWLDVLLQRLRYAVYLYRRTEKIK